MHLTQVLVVIVAIVSVTGEAFVTTADTKLTKVSFDADPNHRFLRAHTIKEAGGDEERFIDLAELKAMAAEGKSKHQFAVDLGIDKHLEVYKTHLVYNGVRFEDFAKTIQFKKFEAYRDYLRELERGVTKEKNQGCCMS